MEQKTAQTEHETLEAEKQLREKRYRFARNALVWERTECRLPALDEPLLAWDNYKPQEGCTYAKRRDLVFNSTSSCVNTTIVYACVILSSLGCWCLVSGRNGAMGCLVNKNPREVASKGKDGVTRSISLRGWSRGTEQGHTCLLYSLCCVWEGNVQTLFRSLFCRDVGCKATDIQNLDLGNCKRTVSKLTPGCKAMLYRMVDFGYVTARAFLVNKYTLPID